MCYHCTAVVPVEISKGLHSYVCFHNNLIGDLRVFVEYLLTYGSHDHPGLLYYYLVSVKSEDIRSIWIWLSVLRLFLFFRADS